MIKNSSVAWQTSGWFTQMSEARRELAFRRASASLVFLVWDLCYIHLLKKEGILTYVKNGVLLLNIFFPERSNVFGPEWQGEHPKDRGSDTTSGRLRLRSMKERQTQSKKAEGTSDMKLGGNGENAYLEPGVQSGQWPCPVCALSL